MINEGKAASAGTREEGRGNQTPAASRAAMSIDDGEAAGGRPPAKNKDVRHHVTTTLQCPRCITVRLTAGPYGQDLSWI